MPKAEAVIVATVLAVVFYFLFWVTLTVFRPPPPRPSISTAFMGYTNDATGMPVARLAITNLNSSGVIRVLRELKIPAPADPSGASTYSLISGVATISGKGYDVVTVPYPTNQPQWKVSFLVYPDTIPIRAIKTTTMGLYQAIGLKPKCRVMFYYFETGWIPGPTNNQTGTSRARAP